MCKRACETIAQASSPERCQRTSPRNSHKQPRENIDLLITSPLQRIAARRARERHAQRHLANQSFRAKRERKFLLFARRVQTLPREARSEIFCTQSPSERATPTKRKQTKKCERFPLRTDSREEEAAEKMRAFPLPRRRQRRENKAKNASVSPCERTPTKREHTKKCERFPCPTTASEEKRSEKTRAFPPAHERPQAQKHTRARAQSARA